MILPSKAKSTRSAFFSHGAFLFLLSPLNSDPDAHGLKKTAPTSLIMSWAIQKGAFQLVDSATQLENTVCLVRLINQADAHSAFLCLRFLFISFNSDARHPKQVMVETKTDQDKP